MVRSVLTFFAAACCLGGVQAMTMQTKPKLELVQEKTGVYGIPEVILLMQGLKTEIEQDGISRANTYKVTACACSDNDFTFSGAIEDDSNRESADAAIIDTDTMSKEEKQSKLAERKADQQSMAAALKAEVVAYSKAAAEYEANAADSAKGIQSLTRAIDTMAAKFGSVNNYVAPVQAMVCTDPDSGDECSAHNTNSATCISQPRTDVAGGDTCIFAAATGATCSDTDSGTLCNMHNANSTTCLAHLDGLSATCVFDAGAATCTDPDTGTTCNAHNANAATCTSKARTDLNGDTCVFAAASTATCTDPNKGTTCSAYKANLATCTRQPRTDAATTPATCVFTAATDATCADPDGGTNCTTHNADQIACEAKTDTAGTSCTFTAATGATCDDSDEGTVCNSHNANENTCVSKPRTDTNGATCLFASFGASAFIQAPSPALIQVSLNDVFEGPVPARLQRYMNNRSMTAVAQDPAYMYHSADITQLLTNSKKSFEDDVIATDLVWGTTTAASTKAKAAYALKMKTNMGEMDRLEVQISFLGTEVAETKGDLVLANTQLDSDTGLLKVTAKSCEVAAREFDRQVALKAEVLKALVEVLKFLGVAETKMGESDTSDGGVITDVQPEVNARIKEIEGNRTARRAALNMSFLQTVPGASLLAKGRSVAEQAKMNQVSSFLRETYRKLQSPELSMLVMKIGGVNHFKGVEGMIHNLIAKLLGENDREISKNAFCETEVAKASKTRTMSKSKADELSADLAKLEADKERLDAQLIAMGAEISADVALVDSLTTMRNATKDKNALTIKHAKDGIVALEQAKKFYKAAAGHQEKVDVEYTPLAGTAEEEIGTNGKSIVVMLKQITVDLHKQVTDTEADDKENEEDYQASKNALKENIKGRETATIMDQMGLDTTNDKIVKTMDDMNSTMILMSDAHTMVASLKPACLDAGGMNFNTRKNKRDEEIAALKLAMKSLK